MIFHPEKYLINECKSNNNDVSNNFYLESKRKKYMNVLIGYPLNNLYQWHLLIF